jgi:phosphoenolpyruvate synthase/pyruvate phosphate dikinase
MKEYYGHCLPYAHLVFNYDNVTWFFKLSEFQNLGKKLIPIYKRKKDQIWQDFEKFASTLWSHKTYRAFHQNYINFWKVAYVTEPISFYIDSLLKPSEQISIQEKSFTDEYEEKIWQLTQEAKKKGLDKIDIGPILKDYFWIRNSYHGLHRLTAEEIKTEVRKKVGKKRPQPKKGEDPTSIPKDLLQTGKDMILMQDKRKKYMMKAAFFLHEFLKAIGKKHGLAPVMMTQTVPWEVLEINRRLPKLREELKLRQRSCTIIGSLTEGIKVSSGEIFFPKGVQRRAKFEIRGNVACGGKAVGPAKIVSRAEEIYKVNHGDIIVAPMTSPEFMPAIRRCVAIVTNFGGITCHAAVVAREFNIPCIVGTKNATERLKDKDLVEVDADSGIVKVLQSEG